ncbi:MAG TPA: hypothetical protein VMW74_09960 [Nitrosopumilaceae archaeon]|nr:hypothetical protein [Nitrosopumilaceae archaeon]
MNYRISYADVIIFLIKEYNKSIKVVYPLCRKLLVAKKNLKQKYECIHIFEGGFIVSSKHDGRTRTPFSLEG